MYLEQLGYDMSYSSGLEQNGELPFEPARIIEVNKEQYVVNNGSKEMKAELSGRFRFTVDNALDLPTVGDWGQIQSLDGDMAIIHALLPRKSLLKRKMAGKKVDFQLIGANIDTAFIVQALDQDFNIRRLERYIVAVNDGGITPVVLFSKSDLLFAGELEERVSEVNRQMPDLEILQFSNLDGTGLAEIRELMIPGRTYCLLGSSGVGKTSLINSLAGEDRFRVNEVREKDHKGKHTTTRRQLIMLDNGAMLVDTPGMREFASIGSQEGINSTFDEISALALECRFKDCTHTTEDGCAVLAAMEKGSLSHERYENYMKIRRENTRLHMAYHERRRKEKEFGKMIKSVMKGKDKGRNRR